MLTITVLGPVTVRRGEELLKLPAGKTSELLVRLALEPGVSIRSDRLVDDLWGVDATSTRPNTLQSKVAKLRRALGDPGAIVSLEGGYRLAVEPSQVDVFVVVGAADEARSLLDAGERRRAVDLCASALDLYAGELLVGAGHVAWVEPHRARLEAVRLQLFEMWCAARLGLGETGEVIADLQLMLADQPFQESLWALLITALYQAGRQADALAAYQRVRAILADELGLEPSPTLQELERQILVHDDRLPSAQHPQSLDRVPSVGNLPALAVELVGRASEVADVAQLAHDHRLVEVIGPGGVGKTALAIAVGRLATRPGGVWLVRLESARTADEVVDSTIAALGAAGGDDALIERLKSAPALLVFDNCEHVLPEISAWVYRLLDAVPSVHILCTSQASLEIDGSKLFELAPLAVDDAVTLFVERSATQRRTSSVHEDDNDLRALCLSLDGLPLAIELAAARTRTLSIEEIAQRLDDRFAVLSDPASRRSERLRALRSTIAWSYDLLFPDDQRGLWALATFAGGATLPAVEFVLAGLGVPQTSTLDVLGRLAARSLLIVDRNDGRTRYRLLDSIRAFALDAMRSAGQSQVAHDAHARWFDDAASQSTGGVRSARQAEHLAFVRDERANIDAALTWCAGQAPQRALSMAAGYGWAWVVLGDSRGAQRLLAAIDVAGDGADPTQRVQALLLAGWVEASTGDLEHARRHVLEAQAQAERLDDLELRARSAYYLAYVVSHNGEFQEGIALTDRSRALYADLDHPWDSAANGLFAARAAISAGDEPRSVRAADEVDRWLRVVDDPWLHVRREAMLGELARLQGRFDDAVDHIACAAETSHRLGFQQTEAYQVAILGRAQCQAGDYKSGAATLALSIERAEAIGDVRMAAVARVHLGRALRALGDLDEARLVLAHSTEWHRRSGGGEQALLGECLSAAIDAVDGVGGARRRLEEVLQQAQVSGDAPVEVLALDGLALVAARAGDLAEARSLVAAADVRMRAAAHFISERDRVDADAVRAAL